MFHRVPFISVTTAAVAVLALLLLMLSPSSFSPGTAHASHGTSLPEVSIKAVMPEVGEEGGYVTVTLKLSRALTADEQYCYSGSASDGSTGEVCIEGGIIVWDTYDDHLYAEGGSKYDNGFVPSDELVKFIFRGSETEKRLSVRIKSDGCITPGRTVQIAINRSFDETDTYGYTINSRKFTVPVSGDNETNSQADCGPVDDGATEEFVGNKAPTLDGLPPTF